jgi:hypothetical protein
VVKEISGLKDELQGEIVVPASFQPVGETSDQKRMRLVDTQTIDGDIAYLTYEAVRDA